VGAGLSHSLKIARIKMVGESLEPFLIGGDQAVAFPPTAGEHIAPAKLSLGRSALHDSLGHSLPPCAREPKREV